MDDELEGGGEVHGRSNRAAVRHSAAGASAAPATASVRAASAAPAAAASRGDGAGQRRGQEAAGEGVAGPGRVDDAARRASRRRVSTWPSARAQLDRPGAVLDDEQAGPRLDHERRLGRRWRTRRPAPASPSSATNRSTPNASTTATDDTSTLTWPPARRMRRDGVERRRADRLGAQRVRRHVQPRDAVEPRRVDRRQLCGRGAVGQHRPLPVRLDEHDDRAGAPAPLHPDVDAAGRRASPTSGSPTRSSPTRPTNRVGQPAAAAAAATLAALPPRGPHDHAPACRCRAPAAPSGGRRRPRRGRRRRTARPPCSTHVSGRPPATPVHRQREPGGGTWGGRPSGDRRSRTAVRRLQWSRGRRRADRRPSPRAARLLVDGRADDDVAGAAAGPTASAGCSPTTPAASCCSPSPTRCCAHPTAGRSMAQLRDLVGAGLPTVAARRRPRRPAPGRRSARASRPAPVAADRPPADPGRDPRRRSSRPTTRRSPATSPRRTADGFAVNVNLLGEAILGDDEAGRPPRRRCCARMRRPDVDYVSVKISALCANLDVLAFDHEVDRIADRLRTRVPRRRGGSDPPVFVNLDMEEYRDLAPDRRRRSAGCSTSRRSAPLAAGIVLQAYLPDTHGVLDDARCAWVAERHRAGGAADQGAPRQGRQPGDGARRRRARRLAAGAVRHQGRRRRQLQGAARPAARRRRGRRPATSASASHNLFDVAWALGRARPPRPRRRRRDRDARGHGPAAGAGDARPTPAALLLYTPVVTDDDFAASIAYLVAAARRERRAGELPALAVHDHARLAGVGAPSGAASSTAVAGARRRSTDPAATRTARPSSAAFDPDAPFANEPDTDFTQAANRAWIAAHLAARPPGAAARRSSTTPAGIDDRRRAGPRAAPRAGGRRRPPSAGAALSRVAEVMAADRGRTIAVMAHETGKTVREGDPEVSEAIDFATLGGGVHARRSTSWPPTASTPTRSASCSSPGRGTSRRRSRPTASSPRWPPATPCSSSRRPRPWPRPSSSSATLHAAGVPDDVVQLVRCPDDDVGRHLVTHPGVDAVVLTGSYDTARLFLDWRPDLRLLAETSGKNALVDQPDGRRRPRPARPRPLGVRPRRPEVLGGQPGHRRGAAVRRRRASSPGSPTPCAACASARRPTCASMVGPLIAPPSGPLRPGPHRARPGRVAGSSSRGRSTTTAGCGRPACASACSPGSWFHRPSASGPVLGVMRADDLDHAVDLQNAVAYGLTGGLHSLDEREIDRWLDRVEVGNAYVNRHTTGAIVRRQPFGGWKRSSVGRGAKTGGPDDILRFVTFRRPGRRRSTRRRARRTGAGGPSSSASSIDRSGLRSEANVLRYRPVRRRRRARRAGRRRPTTSRSLRAAAGVAGVPVEVSAPAGELADVVEDDAAWPPGSVAAGPSGCACWPRSTTRCSSPATTPASPSTRRRSPTTAASSCRAGCASRPISLDPPPPRPHHGRPDASSPALTTGN